MEKNDLLRKTMKTCLNHNGNLSFPLFIPARASSFPSAYIISEAEHPLKKKKFQENLLKCQPILEAAGHDSVSFNIILWQLYHS